MEECQMFLNDPSPSCNYIMACVPSKHLGNVPYENKNALENRIRTWYCKYSISVPSKLFACLYRKYQLQFHKQSAYQPRVQLGVVRHQPIMQTVVEL
jgi:hypothetical protein